MALKCPEFVSPRSSVPIHPSTHRFLCPGAQTVEERARLHHLGRD